MQLLKADPGSLMRHEHVKPESEGLTPIVLLQVSLHSMAAREHVRGEKALLLQMPFTDIYKVPLNS